jgi:hypothetical protein
MNQDLAVSFVRQIKEQGLVVPKLEISSLGGLSFVSAYNEKPQTIMANDASAGVDYNPDLAITKALVEYFERQVFAEGIQAKNPICARDHSDGVAAYPVSEANAKLQARENAYCEALERFVWAKWWDDTSIGHTAGSIEESRFWDNIKLRMTIEASRELLPIENITLIEPFFENRKYSVIIIFASIKGRGYISGGAASPAENRNQIVIRALAELIRHGIALVRFIETKRQPETFYEKRLLYFGMGQGNQLVDSRLKRTTKTVLKLPDLEFDDEIRSERIKNLIVAHRCLFIGQPPFVDGDLERLCL